MRSTTSKDGTTIGWFTSGEGRPLLLVHGTTADHQRWDGIRPKLEEHFTVHAMDRRGRGASTDGPTYDLLREAEDIAAVANAIGEPLSVLGHSYGAVCSLEAGLLTTGVDRLVLYEPPIPTGLSMYPPGVPDRIQGLVDEGANEQALEVFFREVVGMPDSELSRYRQLPMWSGRIKMAPTIARELAIDRRYDFDAAKFAGFETPISLLVGSESPPLFTGAVAAVGEAIPSASVVELANQRHIAMDVDPEMFTGVVLEQLSG